LEREGGSAILRAGSQGLGLLLSRRVELQNLTSQDLVRISVNNRHGELPHPIELAANVLHEQSFFTGRFRESLEPHFLQPVFLQRVPV